MRTLSKWPLCLAVVLLLIVGRATPLCARDRAWTLDDFEGHRLSYAHWLREGCGWYVIDDDPEYEWSGIVNNALLTLAFGDNEKAWELNPLKEFRKGSAARAFHGQLLWAVRKSVVSEDTNRREKGSHAEKHRSGCGQSEHHG